MRAIEIHKGKPNRTLQRKALAVIEALVSDDLCEELEISKPDDILTRKLMSIYEYAHIALNDCRNPHEDWMAKLLKAYKYFKRNKII